MNKNLEYYMNLPYRMDVYPDEEGGYVIGFPDLPGCLTQGENWEGAMKNAAEAKQVWLETALEEGLPVAEPGSLMSYSGQFKLRIPRSLHRDLAQRARQEGISMNQYCLYLLSQNHAARS